MLVTTIPCSSRIQISSPIFLAKSLLSNSFYLPLFFKVFLYLCVSNLLLSAKSSPFVLIRFLFSLAVFIFILFSLFISTFSYSLSSFYLHSMRPQSFEKKSSVSLCVFYLCCSVTYPNHCSTSYPLLLHLFLLPRPCVHSSLHRFSCTSVFLFQLS